MPTLITSISLQHLKQCQKKKHCGLELPQLNASTYAAVPKSYAGLQ